MNKPEISVVMGVYNAAPYLREAIESILNQTFTNFEFIIINDGSTDESLSIIKSYKDDRIVLIDQENRGHSIALNIGLRKAKAKYVARMDSDDRSLPDRFALQYEFLENHPDYFIVGGFYNIIDREGEYVYTKKVPYEWKEIKANAPFFQIAHPSVMYRKDVVLDYGGYNEVVAHFPIEDALLWKTIVLNSDWKVGIITEPVLEYRILPTALTVKTGTVAKITLEVINKFLETGKVEEEDVERYLKAKRKVLPKSRRAFYHLILAKKFLWENYQPNKARKNLNKGITYKPFLLEFYLLYILSFLPGKLIQKIYKKKKK